MHSTLTQAFCCQKAESHTSEESENGQAFLFSPELVLSCVYVENSRFLMPSAEQKGILQEWD